MPSVTRAQVTRVCRFSFGAPDLPRPLRVRGVSGVGALTDDACGELPGDIRGHCGLGDRTLGESALLVRVRTQGCQ